MNGTSIGGRFDFHEWRKISMLDQRSSRLQASSLFLLSLFLVSDLLTGKYQIFEWLGVPRPPVFRCKSAAPDSPAPTRTEREAILTANGLLDLNLKVISVRSTATKEPKADADLSKLVSSVLTLGAAMALIGFLLTSSSHLLLYPVLNSIQTTRVTNANKEVQNNHQKWDAALFEMLRQYFSALIGMNWIDKDNYFWNDALAKMVITHHQRMPDSLRAVISRRWDVVVLSWNFLWIMIYFGIFDCVWAHYLGRTLAWPTKEPAAWAWSLAYLGAILVLKARFSIAWQELLSITEEFASDSSKESKWIPW